MASKAKQGPKRGVSAAEKRYLLNLPGPPAFKGCYRPVWPSSEWPFTAITLTGWNRSKRAVTISDSGRPLAFKL